jgi:hypothetical protein
MYEATPAEGVKRVFYTLQRVRQLIASIYPVVVGLLYGKCHVDVRWPVCALLHAMSHSQPVEHPDVAPKNQPGSHAAHLENIPAVALILQTNPRGC